MAAIPWPLLPGLTPLYRYAGRGPFTGPPGINTRSYDGVLISGSCLTNSAELCGQERLGTPREHVLIGNPQTLSRGGDLTPSHSQNNDPRISLKKVSGIALSKQGSQNSPQERNLSITLSEQSPASPLRDVSPASPLGM